MSFMKKLTKADLQIFLEVFVKEYNLGKSVSFQNFTSLKNDIYLAEYTLDNKKFQFACSDENIKLRKSDELCNEKNIDIYQFKESLKQEWQAFMLAKFGVEYIMKKMIFKPSQTKLFKLVGKYGNLKTTQNHKERQ